MLRHPRGVVAQLVEHHNGIVGVISSILFGSTTFLTWYINDMPSFFFVFVLVIWGQFVANSAYGFR